MAEPGTQSDDQRAAEEGTRRGARSAFLKRLAINALIVIVPVGAYWTFVLMRQQAYEIERGFRALGEIHLQAEKKLASVEDLFRIVPGPNPPIWFRQLSGDEQTTLRSDFGGLLVGLHEMEQSTIQENVRTIEQKLPQFAASRGAEQDPWLEANCGADCMRSIANWDDGVPIVEYREQLQPDLAQVHCLFGEDEKHGHCRQPEPATAMPEICPQPSASRPLLSLEIGPREALIRVHPCHLLQASDGAEGRRVLGTQYEPGALVYFEVDPQDLFGAGKALREFEHVMFGAEDRILATMHPLVSRPGLAGSPHRRVDDSEALLGLRYVITRAADKLGEKTSEGEPPLSASTTVEVELAGRSYTAFVKPVSLELHDRSDLVLVGLRARSDIREAATEPDNRLLFIFLTLIILLIVSWPILRLGLREHDHPISFYELWRVGGALAVVGAVAFVAAYSYDAQQRAAGVARDAIQGRAESIRDELRQAIGDRAALLRQVDESHYLACRDLQQPCTPTDDVCLIDRASGRVPAPVDAAGAPLLEVIGRTNAAGVIEYPVLTATRCRSVPSRIDLSARAYFQLLQGEHRPPLVAQRLVNWANGEKMLQIAVPRGTEGGIVTGDTRLAALSLAPDPGRFTYAVFENATGTVLLHSDPERVLVENVFLETGHDASLLGAVAAGTGQFLTARYYGRSHQFYYLPLAAFGDAPDDPLGSLDWGIAVGFDVDELWSIGLVAWGNVIGVVLAFAVVVWLTGYLLFQFRCTRHWLSRMIWPGGDFHAVVLPSASLAVILVGGVLLLRRDWATFGTATQLVTILIAVFAPVAAWIVGKTMAADSGGVVGWKRALWPYWLLLLVVAVGPVPALLLTPPAWSFHETAFRANQAVAAMNRVAVDDRALKRALPELDVRVPDADGIAFRPHFDPPDCRWPAHGVAAMIWQQVPALRDLLPEYRLDAESDRGRFCIYPENAESSKVQKFSMFDRHTGYLAGVTLSPGLEPQAAGTTWLTALIWIVTIGALGFLCLSIIRLLNEYRFIVRNGRGPCEDVGPTLFLVEDDSKAPAGADGPGELDLTHPPASLPVGRTLLIRGFDALVFGEARDARQRALRVLEELVRNNQCVIATGKKADDVAARLEGFDGDEAAERGRALNCLLVAVPDSGPATLGRLARLRRLLVVETRPLGARAGAAMRRLQPRLKDLNPRELTELVGEELEPKYRAIWKDLDLTQRVALYELAHGVLPGPLQAQVLRSLDRMRLCTLDPFPHIESRSFEDFVAQVEPDLRTEVEEPARRPSAWTSLRTPLVIIVLLGLAWVAYSGGETVQVISAVLAATLGLATRLNQFAEFFRR